MHLILLSGGSGKRLWPLSNESRSKQFLRLLPSNKGNESMVQRVYRQIRNSGINEPIVIMTSKTQLDSIHSQLGDSVEIVTEPERRDTFPAIALAAAYLKYEKKCSREEIVMVLPVDPFTESGYFETIMQMEKAIIKGDSELVLMGVEPTYPSEKYGYIIPDKTESCDEIKVLKFTEKPDTKTAIELMEAGAFWNAGVFGFKLGYILDILDEKIKSNNFKEVYSSYSKLDKTSFDYEVVEKAQSIAMIPFKGIWKDLGTWNTLAEELGSDQGLVIKGEGTANTQIINELDIPMLVLGAKNMVIAASPDGILVTGKNESSFMKPYVEKFQYRPMFEERRWGTYKVLNYTTYGDENKSLTKHLFICKGKNISYQTHTYRDEIWTIVDGEGILILEDEARKVSRGDVISIEAGMKHAIKAITDLTIVEVQIGSELAEQDIKRYEYEWKEL